MPGENLIAFRRRVYGSMSSKKKLSIGITINLENYENLRLQVDGEVGDVDDADELVAYLDSILNHFGRNDPATAKRVDSYRSRVLRKPAVPEEEPKPEEPEAVIYEEEEEMLIAEPVEVIREGNLAESLYHTPVDAACVGEDANRVGEEVCEEVCEMAAPVPPPAKKEKAEEVFVCSMCGAEITKAQEQLSQLFMGKTLCRKCMELEK